MGGGVMCVYPNEVSLLPPTRKKKKKKSKYFLYPSCKKRKNSLQLCLPFLSSSIPQKGYHKGEDKKSSESRRIQKKNLTRAKHRGQKS